MEGKQKPLVLEPPSGAAATSSVIFLHGLGDTAEGWQEIAELLQRSLPDTRWVLPTAPSRPVTINQGMEMPAWYDIVSLEDREANTCEGIEESRELLNQLIEEEKGRGVPSGRIVVGGFSQGAAVSIHTSVQYQGILGGLMALSGYLPVPIAEENRRNLMTPFIMCHGRDDQVVPFQFAKDSFVTMTDDYGLAGTFYPYKKMGHELHPDEFADVLNFLLNQLRG